MNIAPYIRWLTDEYMVFICLYTRESKTSSSTQDNKFDNSRQFEIQIKLKLRHCVVVTGSSRRQVEEVIDEVVSLLAALL
jgi:ribosomal silencing factor RsfS